MTAFIELLLHVIHGIFIAVAASLGLAVCIFIAIFAAYLIWAAVLDSKMEAK